MFKINGCAFIALALLSGCAADVTSEAGNEQNVGEQQQALAVALPARIEAENYVRFFESTPSSNAGNQCNRGDGVDKELTQDVGGGCDVGWTAPGEWLEYDVSVATTANFDVKARVASGQSGKSIRVSVDGVELGDRDTFTGGYQTWQDRVFSNVTITAGTHVFRVLFLTDLTNFNYLNVVASAPTCSDGFKNGSETGIDCGGSCAACVPACIEQTLTRVSASASSQESASFPAANAIDASTSTRWSSAFSNPQSITVDLGSRRRVSKVVLNWEASASANYDIGVSDAAAGPFTTIYTTPAGNGGVDTLANLSGKGRYVRMYSRARTSNFGNSLYDFAISGDPNPNCNGSVQPAPLPWWIHYCTTGDCGNNPPVFKLCPDANPNCSPSRETRIVPQIDGRGIDQMLIPVNSPPGYTLQYVTGNASLSSFLLTNNGPVRLLSDVDLTLTYYNVPAVFGGTTALNLLSETFTTPEVRTTVYRYPSFLVAGEPAELHARGRNIIVTESAIANINPGPMRAYFLPTELATQGEGSFSTGTNDISINYGNPPYIQALGGVNITALPRFSHEYVHELFSEIAASKLPGNSVCLNEGIADSFAYAAGFLPLEDFGPIGLHGSDFSNGCAEAIANPEQHDLGNCPLWQVYRQGKLSTAFNAALLHPQHTINFDSCDLTALRTGNALLVLFSEAAGIDMTSAISLAGIPHAASYAAAKTALGL